jgi:hypothetical protein
MKEHVLRVLIYALIIQEINVINVLHRVFLINKEIVLTKTLILLKEIAKLLIKQIKTNAYNVLNMINLKQSKLGV